MSRYHRSNFEQAINLQPYGGGFYPMQQPMNGMSFAEAAGYHHMHMGRIQESVSAQGLLPNMDFYGGKQANQGNYYPQDGQRPEALQHYKHHHHPRHHYGRALHQHGGHGQHSSDSPNQHYSDTKYDSTYDGATYAAKDANANAKIVAQVAKQMGVDPATAIAAMLVESGGNAKAVGDRGSSFGLFQLHKGGELGKLTPEQAFDPVTNAQTALSYFKGAAIRSRYDGRQCPTSSRQGRLCPQIECSHGASATNLAGNWRGMIG